MRVLILRQQGGAISEGHNNQRIRGDQTLGLGLTPVKKGCAFSGLALLSHM